MVKLGGKNYGPYRTERKAINAAIDAAHLAGSGAGVFVKEKEDQFRAEWLDGRDPYPPKRTPQKRDSGPASTSNRANQ